MSKLNCDILLLIFKELHYANIEGSVVISNVINTLYRCLLVNKTWCKLIIPILWEGILGDLIFRREISCYNIIISHLPNEAKELLKDTSDISIITPQINYIRFCKYLDLHYLNKLRDYLNIKTEELQQVLITKYILFQNSNIAFNNKSLLLEGLTKICKSIKKLDLVGVNWSSEILKLILKLIKAQNNLNNIICREEKNSEALLREFVNISNNNLTSLSVRFYRKTNWDYMKNLSLPKLKFLSVISISTKTLANLIESTKGSLAEIDIFNIYEDDYDNRYVQSIYQNCPNLRYLNLPLSPLLFPPMSELEILLTSCQCLGGLVISNYYTDLGKLLKILTKSSPASLFRFKFCIPDNLESETLELFFENWKGRHPILLQTRDHKFDHLTIIQKYIDEGIIKSHDKYDNGNIFEAFEWIR
ncbi:hypothetical protein RclHR1_04310004 [Rhizophagus clarus]|uniref:F-box domain-containing protein n=1 Tax=Rhizophagus clarus TaxID=94130 RepID=A0A2Z6RL40_9GLOM|nr:hypothetical protein RclHR1_04310004 [Rhizophagus clarus]GES74391.1 hypothetical protein GLOIN_2v1789912 [Rhizophagus clarus]